MFTCVVVENGVFLHDFAFDQRQVKLSNVPERKAASRFLGGHYLKPRINDQTFSFANNV